MHRWGFKRANICFTKLFLVYRGINEVILCEAMNDICTTFSYIQISNKINVNLRVHLHHLLAETLFNIVIGLAIAIFLLQGNNLKINLIRCQIFDGRVRWKLSVSAMDAYMYLAIVFIQYTRQIINVWDEHIYLHFLQQQWTEFYLHRLSIIIYILYYIILVKQRITLFNDSNCRSGTARYYSSFIYNY